MTQSPSRGSSDWKTKYLENLDQQDRQERQHQQMMALLIRAVVRISLVADGIDSKLDKQLAGLRQMLRDEAPSSKDLNTVIEALEGQVKRLDTVKTERTKVITQSFESLVSQLKKLRPQKQAASALGKLGKNIKSRSGLIQEYSALLNELATVQQTVLEGSELRASKPFWHSWHSRSVSEQSPPAEPRAEQQPGPELEPKLERTSQTAKTPVAPLSSQPEQGLDLSDTDNTPRDLIDPASVGSEPPFSRLNVAICDVLRELLEQIEPPATARENYRAVCQQVEAGLNWYEMVPILEDISIIVISAFDNYQQDFEHFLSQLNDRLTDAYSAINISKSAHAEGQVAGRRLTESMREQVSAIQDSVANATEIDQLKTAVNTRLEQIVSAMDTYQASEEESSVSLSEQLDALVQRVKSMESDSERAEQKIEEQRQRALLDVLTQLPNREAYNQRLVEEFERWQRYGRALTMVVCDIDFFKRINDNYGHLAGDKVLRIIAKSIRKRLRKTDFVARFGGEEFVVLMPETDLQQALGVVESVREAIASCPFHFKDQPVSITMSFGMSDFNPEDTPEQVFARADKALYQAKDQGRNQCVADSAGDMGSKAPGPG